LQGEGEEEKEEVFHCPVIVKDSIPKCSLAGRTIIHDIVSSSMSKAYLEQSSYVPFLTIFQVAWATKTIK